MADFFDNVIDSFKQTLDFSLWLYFFAIYLLESVVSGLVVLVFLALGLVAALGSLNVIGIEGFIGLLSSPGQLLANPGFMAFVAICIVLFALMILALLFVASFFVGIRYCLMDSFLRTKKLGLGSAFERARPRALTFFKSSIIVSLAIGIVLTIAFLPLILSIPGIAGSGPASAGLKVVALFLFAFLILIVFAIAMFLLSPFLALIAPAVFFEDKGAVVSLKRAFALAKGNYLPNLGYLIIYTIIVVGVSFVISMVAQFLGLLFMLPMAALGASGSAAGAGIISAMMFYYAVSALLLIPYSVWASSFEAASFRNLFVANLSLKKEAKGPKARAK